MFVLVLEMAVSYELGADVGVVLYEHTRTRNVSEIMRSV